jgi:hypothetical protein
MSPSALLGFPPVCPDIACELQQKKAADFGEGLADLVKATQRQSAISNRWEVDSCGVYLNQQCIAKVFRAKDRSLGWCCRTIEKSGFKTLPDIEADVRATHAEKPELFQDIYAASAMPR